MPISDGLTTTLIETFGFPALLVFILLYGLYQVFEKNSELVKSISTKNAEAFKAAREEHKAERVEWADRNAQAFQAVRDDRKELVEAIRQLEYHIKTK